jgi:hypothetical protein
MNGTILAPVLCMRFNAKATISTGGLLSAINEHIKKIYADGKLTEAATIRKLRIVQAEGSRQVNREVAHFTRSSAI